MIARKFTNEICRDFRAIVNLFTSRNARNVKPCRNQYAIGPFLSRVAGRSLPLFLSPETCPPINTPR
jgi:hypothetical protein